VSFFSLMMVMSASDAAIPQLAVISNAKSEKKRREVQDRIERIVQEFIMAAVYLSSVSS